MDASTPSLARRPVDVRWFVPALGWILAVALALRFFTATQYLVLGLLGAGCVAALVGPLARVLPGPRWLGAVLAGLLPWFVLGGVAVLLGWLLSRQLADQIAAWPDLREQANDLLGQLGRSLGLSEPLTLQDLGSELGGVFTGSGGRSLFATGASLASGVLISLAFLVFGPIFLLAGDDHRVVGPLVTLLPSDRRPQARAVVEELVVRLRWWTLGTLTSMLIVGVASGVGYGLVGVNLAIPLALFAGLSEIVPTFGPLASFLLALLFAATQGTGTIVGVVCVYVVIQILETHVITPLVMRKAVEIPPLVTLFTVVFWGQVFGAAGLLLAIPLDLTVATVAEKLWIEPRRRALAPTPAGGA